MPFQQSFGRPIKSRQQDFGRYDEVTSYNVNVKDAFNLLPVYIMMHDWLVEEGYGTGPLGPTYREDYEFGEVNYINRDNPAIGKDVYIYWRVYKFPTGGFFKYGIDVDWHLFGIKPVEISWKGQKVEVQKGEFEAVVTAYVIYDPGKLWVGWPWAEIKNLMINRTYRNQINMHKKQVYTDAYRFRDLIMNYLKMETFMPIKEVGEFYLKRTLE